MKKMLRRALLGGVAVAAMAAGAQAGELEALKAQLEALQTRVATMEARSAALPEGASLITMQRGSTASADALFANHMLDKSAASRGATIAITPTADLPAPVASIELSGHVRGLAFFHDEGNSAKLDDFDMQARGQIDVRATVDTAMGRVTGGIQVRGDMGGGGNYTPDLDIRTAWATWQMTDALSLTFGQTGQIATLSNVSSGLLTPDHPFGPDNSRRPQFRITYAQGPFNLRFGIEDPSVVGNDNTMPAIAGSMGFNMGPVGFRVGGEVDKTVGSGGTGKSTGWLVNGGVNFAMGGMVNLNAGVVYTNGLAGDGLVDTGHTTSGSVISRKGVKLLGGQVNMGLTMTETTSLNASFGYYDSKGDPTWDKGWNAGANIVYRPVDALQFAAEVGYSSNKRVAGSRDKGLVVGVATWFFF